MEGPGAGLHGIEGSVDCVQHREVALDRPHGDVDVDAEIAVAMVVRALPVERRIEVDRVEDPLVELEDALQRVVPAVAVRLRLSADDEAGSLRAPR